MKAKMEPTREELLLLMGYTVGRIHTIRRILDNEGQHTWHSSISKQLDVMDEEMKPILDKLYPTGNML